jgi:prepilin signal peptidase PulO-like enzyme (type II secretory pathway)
MAIFISSLIAIVPSFLARISKIKEIAFVPYLFIGTLTVFLFDEYFEMFIKSLYE